MNGQYFNEYFNDHNLELIKKNRNVLCKFRINNRKLNLKNYNNKTQKLQEM